MEDRQIGFSRRARYYRQFGVPLLLLVASLLLFTTDKTPNSGWMGQYVAPSFPPLLTGIPVFRPWIPVERLEFHALGDQWFSQNLTYALLAFSVLLVLWREATRLDATLVFLAALAPLGVVLYFAARGGPIYDVTFALSLLLAMVIIARTERATGWRPIAVLAICLVVLDHSRPTGLVLVLAISTFSLAWYLTFRWLLVLLVLAFTLPFHVHQWMSFHTFNLTTYGGANLREVFPFGRNCANEVGRLEMAFEGIVSREFSECANQTTSEIIETLLADPSQALLAVAPEHLQATLWPYPFWHGARLQPDQWAHYWIRLYDLSLLALYAAASISVRLDPRSLLAFFALCFGVFSTLVGHSGSEAVRIMMPFVVLAVWMALALPNRTREMRQRGDRRLHRHIGRRG